MRIHDNLIVHHSNNSSTLVGKLRPNTRKMSKDLAGRMILPTFVAENILTVKLLSFMKKLLFIAIVSAIIVPCTFFASCSDSDEESVVANRTELYNYWQLIGYGSETNFHEIAAEYRTEDETYGNRFYLVFNKDGSFEGRDAINSIHGTYNCEGSRIKINEIVSTLINDVQGDEESTAFLSHLRASTTFVISGNRLRLYYSKDEYMSFEAMGR